MCAHMSKHDFSHLPLVLLQVGQTDVVDDVPGPDQQRGPVLPQQLEEVLVGHVPQEAEHWKTKVKYGKLIRLIRIFFFGEGGRRRKQEVTFFSRSLSPSHKLQIRANIIWEGRAKYANEKWRFFCSCRTLPFLHAFW